LQEDNVVASYYNCAPNCIPVHLTLQPCNQLYNCTTAQLYNCTTVQQYNCTTIQVHNCTSANCTTVQLYTCTPVHLYNCTTAQLYHCATVQLYNSTSDWRRCLVKRFRGGLVFKANRRLYHSTRGLRVIHKKKGACLGVGSGDQGGQPARLARVG